MLRPCRAIDMVFFTQFALPISYAGIVCEEEDKLIGLGAIIIGERKRPWVVLDMKPEMRHKRLTLHRIGRLLVKLGIEKFGKVYVMRDVREPRSKEWLERLGFKETGEVYRGEIVMEAGG